MSAAALADRIRRCRLCAGHLPLGPRPVVQFSETSRVVIVGQAPGTVTHESGHAFDDRSGVRLGEWLGVDFATMHDPERFAIVSMGLCYPGKAAGGDKPPRPECAPTWHSKVWAHLPHDRLTLLVGTYAQRAYLPETKSWPMVRRVKEFRKFLPQFFPLPHPSWRSSIFMRDNPWFTAEVLPALREIVAQRIR